MQVGGAYADCSDWSLRVLWFRLHLAEVDDVCIVIFQFVHGIFEACEALNNVEHTLFALTI
jgi:hypothetical protein